MLGKRQMDQGDEDDSVPPAKKSPPPHHPASGAATALSLPLTGCTLQLVYPEARFTITITSSSPMTAASGSLAAAPADRRE
ncbi:hypothetical protein GPECTOR_116g349 [Gonium pectorale]|uniref:Uncharacterized protein n=1 Tax=Gonium pectorale TaxID=33097 RepID=A0A150FZ10_GONPE|nr:hypothetical protein GPECTOR_116g349 [Gonium pectorale]|eukprot:KXZ42817.1 hypothetical protein GPECTOR_116g349 [Gonium pectorale]